jgi:hypothetical protein
VFEWRHLRAKAQGGVSVIDLGDGIIIIIMIIIIILNDYFDGVLDFPAGKYLRKMSRNEANVR